MSSGIETVAMIPAFNEERTVQDVTLAALFARTIDAVVVVDDGSTDRTLIEAKEVQIIADDKPLEIVSHEENMGKAEAIFSGVKVAEELGKTSIKTLVFLDADLSPISSRLGSNKRVSRKVIEKLLLQPASDISSHDPAFVFNLADQIDIFVRPVRGGRDLMNIAMPERNPMIDKLRMGLDWGAFAGNRAVSYTVWCDMIDALPENGKEITGWEIEAAVNRYMGRRRDENGIKLNRFIGKTLLDGVVNVGSGVKAGGFIKGLDRMAHIHTQAVKALIKYDRIFAES